MNSFKDIWLEKIAEGKVTKADLVHALKEHEKMERPEDEGKEDARTEKVEEALGMEEHHKQAAQASDVLNSNKPTLVVTYAGDDQTSKTFIQNLDKALASSSGLERLQIKAFNSMKESNTVKQLKSPAIGISLYRNGKLVDSLGNANEQAIRKFIDSNKKNLI